MTTLKRQFAIASVCLLFLGENATGREPEKKDVNYEHLLHAILAERTNKNTATAPNAVDSNFILWLLEELKSKTPEEARSARPYAQLRHYPENTQARIEGYSLNVLPRQVPVITAFSALGRNSQSVIPTLIANLSDSDVISRQASAAALGQVGVTNEAVLSALLSGFKDKAPGVRNSVAFSLSKLGSTDSNVVTSLAARLREERSEDVIRTLLLALTESPLTFEKTGFAMVSALEQNPNLSAVIQASIKAFLDRAGNPDLSLKISTTLTEIVFAEQKSMPVRIAAAATLQAIGPHVPSTLRADIQARAESISNFVLKGMLSR
jgi:hypothetical protein